MKRWLNRRTGTIPRKIAGGNADTNDTNLPGTRRMAKGDRLNYLPAWTVKRHFVNRGTKGNDGRYR